MGEVGDLIFALSEKANTTEDAVPMEIPMEIPIPSLSPHPPLLKDPVVKVLNDSPILLYMKARRQLHWWKQHATPQVLDLIEFGLPATWLHSYRMRAAYQEHTSQETQDALSIMSEYLKVSTVRLLSKPPRNLVPWFMVYHPKPRFISNCVAINRCLEPPPYFDSELGNHFSIFDTRPLGQQDRSQARLFPSRTLPRTSRSFQFPNWKPVLPMSQRLFRASLHSISLDPGNENISSEMAESRNSSIHLFGRYNHSRGNQKAPLVPAAHRGARHYKFWFDYQRSKVFARACAIFRCARFVRGSGQRRFFSANLQAKRAPKRGREDFNKDVHAPTKNGRHFGPFSQLAARPSLPSSIHRRHGSLRRSSPACGLGLSMPYPCFPKRSGTRSHQHSPHMAGNAVSWETFQQHCQSRFGQHFTGLGAAQCFNQRSGSRFLGPQCIPHQSQRASSVHTHGNGACSAPRPSQYRHRQLRVIFYLLRHGGKIGKLNEILRPFLHSMNLHSVSLVPRLVPSSQMQADAISRWSVDPGDYSLDPQVFQHLLHVFRNHVHPTVDLFASPSNALLPAFGSRWPQHRPVVVDALSANLASLTDIWCHPPWAVIARWLHRWRVHPHIRALTVVPWWVSESWWPP